jgi:hypothetical protein
VQARILRAEGTPAYSPKELRLLGRLKARDPEAFPTKLQTIHQIKQVFGGTLDAIEETAALDVAPALSQPLAPASPIAARHTSGRSTE